MQDIAYNLYNEINSIRENKSNYFNVFDYSETAIDELALFPEEGDAYIWNEGIARAARH